MLRGLQRMRIGSLHAHQIALAEMLLLLLVEGWQWTLKLSLGVRAAPSPRAVLTEWAAAAIFPPALERVLVGLAAGVALFMPSLERGVVAAAAAVILPPSLERVPLERVAAFFPPPPLEGF